MSIKCSLLGHRFGETTVEREREEEGTEVVITITEMETCSRCGKTRVVSENKEVTTLETADDGTGGSGGDETGGAATEDDDNETDAGGAPSVADTEGVDDAVIIDDEGEEVSAQADARSTETPVPDAESEEIVTEPEETITETDDDAVIIDDAEDDSDRDPGEWPSEDNETAETGGDDGPAVDAGGETATDEASDRDPGEWPDDGADPAERAGESDEVEILDSGTDESGGTGATTGHGPAATSDTGGPETATGGGAAGSAAWPDGDEKQVEEGTAMGDWPEETKRDRSTESNAGPSLDGTESRSITVPEGMFKCSECDFSTEVDSSSLRAGDFCPECHRGTLLQHEDGPVAEE